MRERDVDFQGRTYEVRISEGQQATWPAHQRIETLIAATVVVQDLVTAMYVAVTKQTHIMYTHLGPISVATTTAPTAITAIVHVTASTTAVHVMIVRERDDVREMAIDVKIVGPTATVTGVTTGVKTAATTATLPTTVRARSRDVMMIHHHAAPVAIPAEREEMGG